MTELHKDLTLLGKAVQGTIGADRLETFPAPKVESVRFVTHEVTSFCPVTRQPDIYTVDIEYTPKDKCVESKSLKLYLGSFRDEGIFGEALAATVADDLFRIIEPEDITVKTIQQPRGGLQMTSTAYRYASRENE